MNGCYDLAFKLEKGKGSYSFVKEAREFAQEIRCRSSKLDLMKRWRTWKMLGIWNKLLRKRERLLSIMSGSQNDYMANTHFEAKKLM